MTEEQWEKVLSAWRELADERRVDHSDFSAMLLILRDNWDLFSVEADLDAYLEPRETIRLQAARDEAQAALDKIDEQLAAKQNPNPSPLGR